MIKRLLKSVREYKKPALLTPLCVMGEVVMEVIIPLLMASLIDKGIQQGNMGYILKMGLLLLAACTLALIFGMLSSRFATYASSGFASNLRHDMYYHLQDYSFANIDKFSASSLVTRLTTDVENVQMSFQMCTRMAVRAPIMMIFSLIMCFGINAEMAWIFLGAIPVLGIGLYLIMTRAYPVFERVFKRYDELNNVVGENLHGIRVVKSFVREEKEKEKFNTVSENIYRDYVHAEKILAFNSPLMQFCMYACTLLISWFGARLIVGSGNNGALGMTTGQLTSVLTYATRILMSLMMLSMVFVMITMSRGFGRAHCRGAGGRERPSRTRRIRSIPWQDGSVEFRRRQLPLCRKKAGQASACRMSICAFPPGRRWASWAARVRPSRTLVQLIPRLYDATEGSVLVGGRRRARIRPGDRCASEVAMVLQKNELFSGTIAENLRWGNPDASDEQIRHACRLAQADGFIRSVPATGTTRISSRAARMCPAGRSSACASRARF